jgi:D-arabinose 1-dehydrogenase-like Zn-dependent alcohol dehydrogenase
MTSTFDATALAAQDTSGVLKKMVIQRRKPLENDVVVRILYSGICHSDVHQLRAEWGGQFFYPMVPGHEIVGEVESVGEKVTKWKVGQNVGVGVFVNSCSECEECKSGLQQYCRKFVHYTYNCCVKAPHSHINNHPNGELLFGGYSSHITVNENYVVSIPDNLPMDRAAPLLCAGITVYSPLKHFGKIVQLTSGQTNLSIGVSGFGGLGNAAVKLAKAMGHHVTVISRSSRKEQAAKEAGADEFLISNDKEALAKATRSMHMIIDTIAANHEVVPMFALLKTQGIYCMVGLPPDRIALYAGDVIGKRISLVGSGVGGIEETQEMLNFCSQHNVYSDVELIDAKDVNHAIHSLSLNDASASRFVIRTSETLAPALTNPTWETEDDDRIDPSKFHIHPHATVYPAPVATKL